MAKQLCLMEVVEIYKQSVHGSSAQVATHLDMVAFARGKNTLSGPMDRNQIQY
jgi:hypothetical protein